MPKLAVAAFVLMSAAVAVAPMAVAQTPAAELAKPDRKSVV